MAAAYIIRNRLQALKLAAGFWVYSDSKRFCCLLSHASIFSAQSLFHQCAKRFVSNALNALSQLLCSCLSKSLSLRVKVIEFGSQCQCF